MRLPGTENMDLEDGPADPDIQGANDGTRQQSIHLVSYEPSSDTETPLSASPQIDRGSAPDSAPSPLSYWIDLHPIAEHAGPSPRTISMSLDERTQVVPDVPPVPISHWLDLLPVDYGKEPIPEVSPEPASLFLELHPEPPLATIHSQEPPPELASPSPGLRPAQAVENISPRTVSMSLDERRTQHVPEVPPVPISHWIDLFPVVHNKGSIPEVTPEPALLFLELHPEQPWPVTQKAGDVPLPLATEPPAAVSANIIVPLGTAPISPSSQEVVTAGQDQVDVQKREQQGTEPSICRYPDCMPDGTRYIATSDADMDRHYVEYHA